jgi:hypothetical protein
MKFGFKPPFRLIHACTPVGYDWATICVAFRERKVRPLRGSSTSGAWKPRTALCVTQIRLRGIALSTRVQAERQGPSMTTRSPDLRSCKKKFKYDSTVPPALDRIRTSAKAGPRATIDKAAKSIKRRIETSRAATSWHHGNSSHHHLSWDNSHEVGLGEELPLTDGP